MFTNIGGKIKALAKVQCWIGIVASIIFGMIMIAEIPYEGIIGLLIMIIGSFLSWISSFVLYGFGELIEKTSNVEAMMGMSKFQTPQNTNPNANQNANQNANPQMQIALENLMRERENESITAEEYRQRRMEILQAYGMVER